MKSADDPIVILLPGPRIRQEEAHALDQLLEQNLETRSNKIILDFSHVEWVDSSFLNILLEAQQEAQTKGGRIVLASPLDSVLSLFRLMRLEAYFQVFETVEKAMEAFDGK